MILNENIDPNKLTGKDGMVLFSRAGKDNSPYDFKIAFASNRATLDECRGKYTRVDEPVEGVIDVCPD